MITYTTMNFRKELCLSYFTSLVQKVVQVQYIGLICDSTLELFSDFFFTLAKKLFFHWLLIDVYIKSSSQKHYSRRKKWTIRCDSECFTFLWRKIDMTGFGAKFYRVSLCIRVYLTFMYVSFDVSNSFDWVWAVSTIREPRTMIVVH